ncbi:hypothetical protein [Cryobacterium sp. SO1]|uniref:hypothetical protein n=1 Tax=Cryobacterium sp. SO1 TaxID=1897061 RepID=UPI0010231038|nr:hypothetical protein [Cryobacterium sp. SO1]RZI37266.1 hypothetical protein BJQ95_00305 [Cryobacterium sp. SO1]
MGNSERLISPFIAARFAVALMLTAVATAAAAVLMLALSRGATLGEALEAVTGANPGHAAVAVLVGTATLALLLVLSPPFGRWGLGVRSALAGYAGLIAGTLSLLLVAEWIPGQPGAVGGVAVLAAAILGFTVAGGPLWIGLIAALLGRTLLLPVGLGTQPFSTSERSRFGTVLIVAGLGVAVLTTAGAFLVAMHGGLDYACAVEGPFSSLAQVSERSGVVTGSFSWWPLGRSCSWAAASSGGTVLATSGWGNTVFVAAMLAVAVMGVVLRTTRTRQADVAAPATHSPL